MTGGMNQTSLLEKESHTICFSKASPDAVQAILSALNAELDEAMSQMRLPTLDGALKRLGPTASCIQ